MKKTLLSALIISTLTATAQAAVESPAVTQSGAGEQVPPAHNMLLKKELKVEKNYPGLIGKLVDRGLTVKEKFAVNDKMDGYVLDQNGTSSIVYEVGGFVISGVVFDPQGNNVSSAFNEKYIPLPDADESVADIKKRGTIVKEGTSDREIYVFIDPECPHCSDYYKKTRQLIKDGKLTINWVVVGFLSKMSKQKAGYIVGAKDKVKAIQDIELGYSPKEASPDDQRKAQINQVLMQNAGIGGTPGIIYKKDGKWLVAKNGLPAERILSTID